MTLVSPLAFYGVANFLGEVRLARYELFSKKQFRRFGPYSKRHSDEAFGM